VVKLESFIFEHGFLISDEEDEVMNEQQLSLDLCPKRLKTGEGDAVTSYPFPTF